MSPIFFSFSEKKANRLATPMLGERTLASMVRPCAWFLSGRFARLINCKGPSTMAEYERAVRRTKTYERGTPSVRAIECLPGDEEG